MKPLRLLPFALLVLGCEGATTMTHTFHNRTEDTLTFLARFDSLPFHDSVSVVLPPDGQHTVYTYDMLGKCTSCGALQVATAWVDTLELQDATWAAYPVESDWFTEVSEGTSWIQFDHTLNVGVGMVD